VWKHSYARFCGFLLLVCEKFGLAPDSVAIYFVEDTGEGSRLRPVTLDANGDVDWWPDGVFSEAFEEVRALRRAQKYRGDK
jgi:predicted ATPase